MTPIRPNRNFGPINTLANGARRLKLRDRLTPTLHRLPLGLINIQSTFVKADESSVCDLRRSDLTEASLADASLTPT